MPDPEMSPIERLQERLERYAVSRTREWWERYLKHVIPFRGVKMADIRKALHEWLAEEKIVSKRSPEDQVEIALELLRLRYAEDKLSGILYLQEILVPENAIDCSYDLNQFAGLFREGHIADWNTCDWFSVKVLGPLVKSKGHECALCIAEWRTAENLWQRRASGVAFVNLAKKGEDNFPGFTDLVLEVCDATVRHKERFAQTGTGWVLRELGRAEPARVIEFLEDHLDYLSREALKTALEQMPEQVRSRFLKK